MLLRMDNRSPGGYKWATPVLAKKLFILFICALSLVGARATPANKAAMQRHFGPFLGKGLDRCTTCHLPSANKNPESLDEFPHNAFGKTVRALGKSKTISERLNALAKDDADKDGVSNETELLLGHNPGDATDTPPKRETPGMAEFRKYRDAYQWRPFDAVRQPAVPKVKNKQWVRNAIDAFVATQHEGRNLKPRPEASKEILLRRIYLDLIGLSPTPAEMTAFLEDSSPKAYEKVVDQLLADERYGERWGRHWLDIWRYSDWAGWSGGNQIRDSKPHIWRWRDWTIEALNNDKPYDQMIVEMLAADELAPNDTNALRATGFLVRNYKMLSREQWLEDTVKHTSQAFLGVTMGCAKCHNHMYDPISQKEYYQFRAIFEPHQVRTDRVPGETDTAKDGLVRTYDVGTNPPTYFFIRGDERKPETNRVIQPGVPRALKGSFVAMPVILPQIAARPDSRRFVIDDQLRESKAAIAAAEKETKHSELKVEIAKTKHEALLTLVELEANTSTNLAKKAVSLQRRVAVLEAKLKVEQTEKEDEKKKAQAKLEEAEKVAATEPDTNYKPRTTENYPEFSTGRRLGLAKWIASRENPLTARVAMNHIWLRHFGQAIVGTPADFGFNGKTPTDPALLDWLAAEFMKRNWSMKEMHRLIVTSSAYRMSSTPDLANAKIDPDNIYLWRMPSRRMEGELVRDNLLHVAGDLDATMGGPEIDHAKGLSSKRRSVYLRLAAEKEVEFLKIFDGPSVTECYMRRPSVVPQQALALANSDIALREAKALASSLKSDDFVEAAYQRVLARAPKPEEKKMCADFLAEEEKKTSRERARQNFVLVLFNHNDFVTIR
jgi:hypothetical protein